MATSARLPAGAAKKSQKLAMALEPPNTSMRTSRQPILEPQFLHFPPRQTYDTTGTSSIGDRSFPQPGQWDLVFTNSSPRGTRKITTFRKEYTLAPRKNRKTHMRILNHKGRIISNFPHYIFSGASNPSTEMQSSITFFVSSSSAIQPAFFVSSSSVRILVS